MVRGNILLPGKSQGISFWTKSGHPEFLSGLICDQTIFIGYQQVTLADEELIHIIRTSNSIENDKF